MALSWNFVVAVSGNNYETRRDGMGTYGRDGYLGCW